MSECRKVCEHDSFTMSIEEYARLSEGVCVQCDIAAERSGDGFAACPCCGVEWKIEGRHVTLRAPFALDELIAAVALAGDSANGAGTASATGPAPTSQ